MNESRSFLTLLGFIRALALKNTSYILEMNLKGLQASESGKNVMESREISQWYIHSTSRNRTSAPLPLPSPSWCLIPFTRSQITILAIDRYLKTEIGTMEGSHAIFMWLKFPLKNVKTWKFSYIILWPPRKIFLVVLPVFWSIFSTWNTLLYVCLN